MIKIVLYAMGGLVSVVAVMAVIGLFLRPDHLAARSATLPRPQAEVWATLIDVEALPRWRKDLERVELLPAVDGKRAFRERGEQGDIAYVVDEEVAPAGAAAGRLVTRIADEALPFGGRWIVTVAPADGGSRVTVTEDGFVKNPLFRFLSRTVYSLTATQEQWLRNLGRHLGAEVTPAPAEPQR
jgi:hypothetical protein